MYLLQKFWKTGKTKANKIIQNSIARCYHLHLNVSSAFLLHTFLQY